MEVWQQTGKYIIVTDGCCSTLQILNFDKIDIGDYYAAVDNDEISAPARLNLEVSPTIRIREQIENSVLVNAHAELDFHIEVAGHPVPTMTILHNDARIQARALMEKYEDVIRIRMKNLTQADSGVVTITAENTNGVDQKVFNVVVVDVPSAPTDLCATNVTTSSALLSWNCPKDTNGSSITGFIIQRKTVDSVRWRTVGKTDATTLAFEAGDLFSGEEYLFRVIAVNSVGEGPPSPQVEVLTVSDNEDSEGFSEALSSEVVILDTPKTPTVKQDGDKVNLTWNAVEAATFYKLERSSGYDDWLEIAVVTRTSYVDCSVVDNVSYSYRVTAMSANSMSNPSNGTTPVSVKEVQVPKSSQSSKDSCDIIDAAGKGENKEQENVNEVGIHGADTASAKETIKKEKHREKLEDQREEQEKEESTPKTTKKKQPSPVDDILDTKQRLKKRVRDGQERRPSLQQECSNVPERKHSLPGAMKNDFETTPSPLETKLKGRQEGATPDSTPATKSVVASDSMIDADITATTSSSQAANAQANPFTNVTSTSLVVKAGEPAQISINVRRSTDVHCTWKKDGRPIK
ncbi:fibronectin type III domain protein, partial [Ancylostoma duodenale]